MSEEKENTTPDLSDDITPEQRRAYVDQLDKKRVQTFQTMFYAVQRLDLLTISISGAGVYVVLETIKYVHQNINSQSTTMLKWSGVFLVAAVVINCFAQWSSYKAHQYSLSIIDKVKNAWENKQENEKSVQDSISLDMNHEKTYDSMTRAGNLISILAMMAGLAILILYFSITF